MLFSGKIPFHVAARLTPRFWVPHLLRFRTIRYCSPLFALFETICTIRTISYSLFGTIRYSRLFAIRVFQTPNGGSSLFAHNEIISQEHMRQLGGKKTIKGRSALCVHSLGSTLGGRPEDYFDVP